MFYLFFASIWEEWFTKSFSPQFTYLYVCMKLTNTINKNKKINIFWKYFLKYLFKFILNFILNFVLKLEFWVFLEEAYP